MKIGKTLSRASRRKPREESSLGDKLLRSAQQARDWVQGKPVRVRVTYVPARQRAALTGQLRALKSDWKEKKLK